MSRSMRVWTMGRLLAALCTAGMASVLVVGAGTALADPDDQQPGDPGAPGAVAAPGDSPAPQAPPPVADPLAVPPPSDPGLPPLATPAAVGPVAGQDSTPFTGAPPFHPPTFNPTNGSMVGVGKPIIINFAVPIADQAMAERAIHISSIPPVPGKFYWMSPTQVRWRPTPW
jgi:hypothetical protein